MKKENTIKLDPAFINQKEFTDTTTFDNIEVEKYTDRLEFIFVDKSNEKYKEFLRYKIGKQEIFFRGQILKIEDFLEHQKLINQALDYITVYNKTIENN